MIPKPRKRKLLVAAPYFYPKIGGMEKYAWQISRGLHEKYGWEVVAVTSNHEEKKYKEEIIDGIKIYRLPYWFKISNTPINPMWYFDLKRIIKKEKPDIINGHSPVPFMADMAALASGEINFVLTYHSGSMKKFHGIVDVFINYYERFILPRISHKAKRIICASEFIRRSNFENMKKAMVVTPGVDTSIFRPSTTERDKNTVLFVGNQKEMYELKGLNYLIEAVKSLPNINLKIVGEKIQSESPRVKYLGYLTQQELAYEMQKATVFVLPSIVEEGFGTAIAEAMACGAPVISTNSGGANEAVTDGVDGYIIPPKDTEELKKLISLIVGNIEKVKNIGDSGSRKISNYYDWKSKVKQTDNIFENI